jgi:mono/diheme cytochrome c family protein
MRAALLVLVAVLAVLVGVGASEQEFRSPEERGEHLFVVQGCYGCHTVGAFGTPIAPDLSAVGRKYSEGKLAAWLRDPAAEDPGAHMPKLDIAPADIESLAAYLASLRRPTS